METFSDIHLYINGTDVFDDLLTGEILTWSNGILSGSPADRVATPGQITFKLNNSATNSAGSAGYYTPGHANSGGIVDIGNPVSLRFTFEGITFEKFQGKIQPGGITVSTGTNGIRQTQVTAFDWFHTAGLSPVNQLTRQTLKRADEGIATLDDTLITMYEEKQYETGRETFVSIFDNCNENTTVLSEINKLVMSEFGYFYINRYFWVTNPDVGVPRYTNCMRFEDRFYRAGIINFNLPKSDNESVEFNTEEVLASVPVPLLAEDGTQMLCNELQSASFDNSALADYGTWTSVARNYITQARVTVYPKTIDAAATTVLYSLVQPFKIEASATRTMFCPYIDPTGAGRRVNGMDMVTPAAGTDYTAGTSVTGGGTALTANLSVTATYFSESVKYVLQETSGTAALYVNKLQARGKGIYSYNPVIGKVLTGNETNYGYITMDIDMKYQSRPAIAEGLATELATELGGTYRLHIENPAYLANENGMHMYGFLMLEPGRRALFKEDQTAVNANYFINGYEAELHPGGKVIWKPYIIPATWCEFSTSYNDS